MAKETEDSYQLKRFILRIAVPFAVAAIIIAIIQFVLTVWFNKENVRPIPSEENRQSSTMSNFENADSLQLSD